MNRRLLLCTATALSMGCSTRDAPDPGRGPAVEVPANPIPPFAQLQFIAALQPDPAGIVDGLGGLSGIAWDAEREVLVAISDDPGVHGPVRLYEFELRLPGPGDGGAWKATRAIALTRDGEPLPRGQTDAESIALLGDRLLISSEGTPAAPPFLRAFDRNGAQQQEWSLPEHVMPSDGRGMRPNLGLEAVATLPSGMIFAGLENALAQDGPAAAARVSSPARILRWDPAGGVDEFVYQTGPVVHAPASPEDFHTNGLVELLALDENRLLALERSYTTGFDNGIRLYLVDLGRAGNVAGQEALGGEIRAAGKVLLADLSRLDFNLDNVEGMTWGPRLEDGRRTLLAVSDNNFSRDQTTHLLIFAVSEEVPAIPAIQGRGHSSPLAGHWLFGVEGTVTQIRSNTDGRSTLWLQAPGDGDPSTSDGLRATYDTAFDLRPGDLVTAWGHLAEAGRDGELPVTTLTASYVAVTGTGAVPDPIRLDPRSDGEDPGERSLGPLPLDDDGMDGFDPAASTIDLLESLEGMRATLPESTAVSGTSIFGEIALLPDGADGLRSPAGGVMLTPDTFNPQRIIAIGGRSQPAPELRVGDRFDEPLTGVLDYSFGNFKLVVERWPEVRRAARPPAPPTVPWSAAPEDFTFASYNVLNLDPSDRDHPDGDQFDRLAASIVAGLASPDVIALQEIQDNNGAADEGVTGAEVTLDMLVDAVVDAGGPHYSYTQIDPFHDREGGQPVGNIRVAYLYRPERVELVERGAGDTATSTEIDDEGAFTLSPGRIAVEHPAFVGDDVRGWEPGRRCLAAEFQVNGRIWPFVNCHLKSKRGDDRLFGPSQPPVFHTEEQRSAQAEVLAGLARRILDRARDAPLVILGDTNEHEFRRPIRILTGAGLTNLVDHVDPAGRYTYNFNGNSQVLDNVLVGPAVVACRPEVAIVHWNTDLPDSQRASDHDPVAVRVPRCAGSGQ